MHEYRELNYDRPGAEVRQDPATLENLDVSLDDGREAVCCVALLEQCRTRSRIDHRDFSVELFHVLVDDEPERTHRSNR